MKDALRHWEEVRGKLRSKKSVLWFFDLDGTLAPIERRPELIQVSASVRQHLSAMARRYPKRVGVLSGRSVDDARRNVHVRGLFYSGTHGLEIRGHGLHRDHPAAGTWKKKLQIFAKLWEPYLQLVPGMWLEKKVYARCLHYRETDQQYAAPLERMLQNFKSAARKEGFRVLEGLKSVEVLPKVRWDKGEAARWLMQKTGARKMFFIGDDTTDEAVFKGLGPAHVTIRVGKSDASRAGYYITNQKAVTPLLERLAEL